MQYVEIAKIVLAVLAFLLDLIKDIKADKAGDAPNTDTLVDRGLELLGNVGGVAKVKELNGIDLKEFAPEVKAIVSRLHDLHLSLPSKS